MEKEELERELESLHPQSFGWALGCCGRNREEAEDVLQAAYVKILEGRAKFGGRSSFKTWLFAVIRRTASESRRRAFFRDLFLKTVAAQSRSGSPADDAQARIERSQQSRRLILALGSLARRQREVLELVFYHGMTIDEAAEAIGVSPGTARAHYERGKKKLWQKLDAETSP